VYQDSFPDNERKATLRWLELHAEYDDVHPWEALEIVCTAMGRNPKVEQVTHIRECIKRTYTSQLVSVSRCLEHSRPAVVAVAAVA
ncbi:MAG: TenA family transcriptional regulator, partial [Rhodanobacter sp.]